jgi:tetratricopeptide (TPR) repeat protein
VHYHQKRVEYAVRSNDRPRLVEAYLALAECLFRSGQADKSKAVYGRVLELAPDDARAQSAMREAFGTREMSKAMIQEAAAAAIAKDAASKTPVAPPLAPPLAPPVAANGAAPAPPAPAAPPAPKRRSDPTPVPTRADAPPLVPEPPKRPVTPRRESFVNLSDWLRDDEPEKSTRIVSANTETPSEQVGFAEMLTMFKQGVAANVEETDHESHYDLGVAYKEMGLLDEAISEFQKALRGTEQRVRTYEALGQCFVEKRQYQIALTILARALSDKDTPDETLVGVLYLLGYASESLGQMDEALKYYERVFAQDIQFRDIGERLAATERKAR